MVRILNALCCFLLSLDRAKRIQVSRNGYYKLKEAALLNYLLHRLYTPTNRQWCGIFGLGLHALNSLALCCHPWHLEYLLSVLIALQWYITSLLSRAIGIQPRWLLVLRTYLEHSGSTMEVETDVLLMLVSSPGLLSQHALLKHALLLQCSFGSNLWLAVIYC